MSRISRRWGAAVAVSALTLTTLAVAGPAQAVTADPRPPTDGATWLSAQLTDGLVHNTQYDFDDYGLTIDLALALDALGGRDAEVQQISDTVAAGIANYIGYDPEQYAGATAKAIVLAQAAGDPATSYGGVDLVERLEGLVSADPTTLGRIRDASAYGDYANVLGQAYAAQGLTDAGSSRAVDVTGFLLEQQCSAGFFRLYFAEETQPDQTCDGGVSSGASAPDTDATAIAVTALASQDTPAVGAALTKAGDWLLDQQKRDGSFGGGTATEGSNANSTGLAGQALAVLGKPTAARRAAIWVRRHQVHEAGACTTALHAEQGAIAYDDAGLAAARRDGIDDTTSDQWRRATTQALPVLALAPAASSALTATAPSDYVRAGSRTRVRLAGLAPGDSACVQRRGIAASALANRFGKATARPRVPSGTADRTFAVRDASGRSTTVLLKALGATTFTVHLRRAHLPAGTRQHLGVRGLASHERLSVVYRGHVIRTTRANRYGRYRTTFRVGRRAGHVRVSVLGQFPRSRSGAAAFTVR